MQSVSDGYTIVEILVVLAVTSFILIVSILFLSGREASTHFSQSMIDIQSKIEDWINDVSTGFPASELSEVNCHMSGVNVVINNGATAPGSLPDCVFLGRTIQFKDKPAGSIYSYAVFGSRLDIINRDELAGDLTAAAPVPAVGDSIPGNSVSTGSAHLTEEFIIPAQTKVKSINSATVNNSHMAGFYLNLNTEQSAGGNGSAAVKAYQYPLADANPDSDDVIKCIKMIAPQCPLGGQRNPKELVEWQICFLSADEDKTALLTIRSISGSGATTQLEFKPC